MMDRSIVAISACVVIVALWDPGWAMVAWLKDWWVACKHRESPCPPSPRPDPTSGPRILWSGMGDVERTLDGATIVPVSFDFSTDLDGGLGGELRCKVINRDWTSQEQHDDGQ